MISAFSFPNVGFGKLKAEIWLLPLLGLLALTIAGLKLEYLLLAAAAVAAVALSLTQPRWVLYLLLLSVPFASLAEIDAGDFTISATEGLAALLAISWLLPAMARREVRLEGGALLAAMLWVLGVMLLITPSATRLSLAMKETVKWLELIVAFLFATQYVKTWVSVQRVIGVLLLSGAAESAYALVQVVVGAGPSSFAVGDVLRASGTFDQPNPFAGYLGTLLPLGVLLALTVPTRLQKAGAWLGVSIVLAGFLASQSRGAWLGLAVATLLVLLVWSPRSRALLLPLGYLAAIGGILAVVGVLPEAVTGRLGVIFDYFGLFDVRAVPVTSENFAVVERMAHWQAGWLMFLDHPLLGVGPGNYPAVYERYFLDGWVDALGHAHNYYLNVAAEIGVVGLAGVAALLVVAFRSIVKALREPTVVGARNGVWEAASGVRSKALASALLASLVVFCLHNLFDNLLVHGMSVQVGLILGLVHVAGKDPLLS